MLPIDALSRTSRAHSPGTEDRGANQSNLSTLVACILNYRDIKVTAEREQRDIYQADYLPETNAADSLAALSETPQAIIITETVKEKW